MGTQKAGKMSFPSIVIYGVIVPVLNEPVGNLGFVFDPNMNMSVHVSGQISSQHQVSKLPPQKHWKNTKVSQH